MKDVLNEWIGLINYLVVIQSALSHLQDPDSSSISPALLRRRADTMSPSADRPVPSRQPSIYAVVQDPNNPLIELGLLNDESVDGWIRSEHDGDGK